MLFFWNKVKPVDTSTDAIWDDIMTLEQSGTVQKREIPFVYSYRPWIHRKSKHLRIRQIHHRHSTRKHKHKSSRRVRIFPYALEDKKRWGRRVAINMQPPPQRVYGQTILNKQGRRIFTDAELIGTPGERTVTEWQIRQCRLVPDPNCPSGQTGPPGEGGADGEDGFDGLPGTHGLDGDTDTKDCVQCPEGPPGPQGPIGLSGQRGVRGPSGTPGVANLVPGPPGTAGERGRPGADGPPGAPGESGKFATRWICAPGEKGHPGVQGRAGHPGAQGIQGHIGDTGRTGEQGDRGAEGAPGPRGKPGPSGRKGRMPNGLRYCECPARTKAFRGYIMTAIEEGKEAGGYPTDLMFE